MYITCVSDLHGFCPELPGGDLLIVAGDLTAKDTEPEYQKLIYWLSQQEYKKKIVIAGNHDGQVWENPGLFKFADCTYLCDAAAEFEGLKIWGSPWTPKYCGWDFMLHPHELQEKWALIPEDTDILVTHGPPATMLDVADGENCGCRHLMKRVLEIKPRLHVFGHIHEGYGTLNHNGTLFVNAAIMNGCYRPLNKPWSFDL